MLIFFFALVLAGCSSINELAYSGLILISWLRVHQSRTVVDTFKGHVLYQSLKALNDEFSPGIRIAKDVVDNIYIDYLHKLRKQMDRENIGAVVNGLTSNMTSDYFKRDVIVAVTSLRIFSGIWRFMDVRDERLEGDNMLQEYIENAFVAFKTFYLVHTDYNEYARFPASILTRNWTLRKYLKRLRDFLKRVLSVYDFGATFPDTVMTISLVNYLKYIALIEADHSAAKEADDLMNEILMVVRNVKYIPLFTYSFIYPEDLVTVCCMPQERKGNKPMFFFIRDLDNGVNLYVSAVDVSTSEQARHKVNDIYQRKGLFVNVKKL